MAIVAKDYPLMKNTAGIVELEQHLRIMKMIICLHFQFMTSGFFDLDIDFSPYIEKLIPKKILKGKSVPADI